MSFTEAVRSGFDNYVNFDGRASRPAFWWWVLFEILVLAATYIVGVVVLDTTILYFLALIALFLPGLAVGVRRLHDTDRSGWWIVIGYIPFVNFIGGIVLLVFFIQKSDPVDNKFGPPPSVLNAPPPPAPAA